MKPATTLSVNQRPLRSMQTKAAAVKVKFSLKRFKGDTNEV